MKIEVSLLKTTSNLILSKQVQFIGSTISQVLPITLANTLKSYTQHIITTNSMAERLDIVIFGASGYTGKFCIEAVIKLSKSNGRSLTWGVAGRSEAKLKDALSETQTKIGEDLSSIPIIIADVQNQDSLSKMAAGARIIINATGPYRFYGEPVIKACIENGTHQVDVSGEPQYMESVQLKYHTAAQEKGIYIVSACGFDSIPADLGVVYLQKQFEGTLNSVETYLQSAEESPKTPGPSGNYATWESAVHGFANAKELVSLRKKLFPTRLPTFTPKLNPKPSIHKSKVINSWCVPFVGSDRSVILRSQRYLYEAKKVRPVQVQTYMGLESVFYLVLIAMFGAIFQFLAKYEFGRSLLLKYPALFSAGLFSQESPSLKKVERTKFSIVFHGLGWSEKLADIDDVYTTKPNKLVVGRVSGKNPGYGLTGTAVTLAAITILTEADKLPAKGGVYPPGAAFADTSLIDELQENGLNFEITSVTDV